MNTIKLTDISDIYENKEKYLDKKIRVSGWIEKDEADSERKSFSVDLRFDFERNSNSAVLPLIFKRNKELDLKFNDLLNNDYLGGIEGELITDPQNKILGLKVSYVDEITFYHGWVGQGLAIIKRTKAEVLN